MFIIIIYLIYLGFRRVNPTEVCPTASPPPTQTNKPPNQPHQP